MMPDILDNDNTTASMGANATFNGALEMAGDRDWIRILMPEGKAVQVSLDGDGLDALRDPYLRIYDATDTQVASNDDAGLGRPNSEVIFQADVAGTYYIEAASFFDRSDGTYKITTQTGPLLSIGWGTKINLEVVNVYFATNGQTYDDYTSEGFNAYERRQIIEIMENLSDAVDLGFNIVTDPDQAEEVVLVFRPFCNLVKVDHGFISGC